MKKWIFLVCCMLATLHMMGQIQGVVTDNTGSPLVGIVVQDPQSGATTTTDMNGSFQLNVPVGSELEIASLGFFTRKVKAEPFMKVIMHSKGDAYSENLKFFFLINGQTSFPLSPAAGFTIGVVRKAGWYFNAMTGFGFHFGNNWPAVNGEVYSNYAIGAVNERPFYTGMRSDQFISATTGVLAQLGRRSPAYWYLGLGYGFKSVTYQTNANEWITWTSSSNLNDPSPMHSICFESGFLFNIYGFAISAGYEAVMGIANYHTISVCHELKIGIGGIFNCK